MRSNGKKIRFGVLSTARIGVKKAMATTSVCSPFCIAGMTLIYQYRKSKKAN
jgi:3-methyladenine DNA glycosylase Mpg